MAGPRRQLAKFWSVLPMSPANSKRPATSRLLREWDRRGARDLELRAGLLAVLREEWEARQARKVPARPTRSLARA